jgi:adenosine kinase
MATFTNTTGETKSNTTVLLGMGNPLLDISANVGQDIFTKYAVLPGNAILAEEKHQPLYKELVDNFDVEYIAGGATQNSIRVAQWMLQDNLPGICAYTGCIGNDTFGESLENSANTAGVTCLYQKSEKATGTCAVLIQDAERSLVANLAAAEDFKITHWEQDSVKAAMNSASVFYMASFFLTHSTDSAELIGKHASENGKIFCVNLAAPFLVEFFGSQVDSIMPYVDFLFGNETEAAALAKAKGWLDEAGNPVSTAECARRAARSPKANGSRPRVVVFTQGSDSTCVACCENVSIYPVDALPREKLVDTNGAGDAFVGGFLSQLVQAKDLATCVRAGHYSARVIIQRSGCTMPAKHEFA